MNGVRTSMKLHRPLHSNDEDADKSMVKSVQLEPEEQKRAQ